MQIHHSFMFFQHTGGNNILKATLYLIEELDIVSLLTLQEAVQERLETVVADKTSKVILSIAASYLFLHICLLTCRKAFYKYSNFAQ